jgi:L-ascorbate metabolism protein UlaG (beta-lactamase superfamily)
MATKKSKGRMRVLKVLKVLIIGTLMIIGLGLAIERTSPFGGRATGDRLARMDDSTLFVDGKAQNLVPIDLGMSRKYIGAIKRYIRGGQEPVVELPVTTPVFDAPSTDAQITWLGHSSMVVELDGVRVLFDPVLSERASPFQFMGPKRFHSAPLAPSQLPQVDAVVISHDHYDHLDRMTIMELASRGVRFLVPLGVGAHLEAWDVPLAQIEELEWWQEASVGEVRLVCTPARHFSGRGFTDRNRTLWASWALLGKTQRIWFSGDTGAFPQASEIGERLGPFDLAMIEVGAFDRAWESVHLGPDGAMEMVDQVRGNVLFPIHWGTFNLAAHRWDQPIVRVLELAAQRDLPVMVPAAGQTQDVRAPEVHPFWVGRAKIWQDRGWPSTAE